jgi:two-component system NtrC family sensor kinase
VALHDRVSGTFVGKAYLGRLAGRWQFNVARRRFSSDGRFDGVIDVSENPDYFENSWRSIGDNDGVITLTRSDGAVLARYPEAPTPVPGVPTDILARILEQPAHGNPPTASAVDGRVRRFYMRVSGYPLIVSYGLDMASITGLWSASFVPAGAVIVSGWLLLALVGWMALRGLAREGVARNLLQAEMLRRERAETVAQQARRMEALGQLTAGIAHDFNNLLAVIMGNMEMLRDVVPAPKRRMADAAITAATRGASLTRQMLTFARRQMLRPEPRDLNADLAQFDPLLRGALKQDIDVRYRWTDEPTVCSIDRTEFEIAVLNIATNARHAMPAGGRFEIATRRLRVSEREAATLDLAPGDFLCITFADSGCGMSAEVRARAFDPFFTTRDVGEGSGLGLSQVYGFAKQSGGAVSLESELGAGTTVSLFLPKAEASAAADPAPSDARRIGGLVLVVDDADDVLDVVAETLSAAGCTVLRANGAEPALELLGRHRGAIRLLLTDLVMPGGISGTELMARARAIDPELPVLLMTGHAGTELRADTDDVVMLRKPFHRADLLAAVARAMEARLTRTVSGAAD